jgi:N-acetyl-anhydromuramyl-L-alanine amidase AmpD
MKKLDLKTIKQIPLPESEYFKENTNKKQIVLHHTAGSSSATNVVNGWRVDKRGRVATCVVIAGEGARNDKDGEIIQCFSSRNWAYHLAADVPLFKEFGLNWQNLDKISIGIEICNWGFLVERNGKFYNYVNGEIPKNQITELEKPYKGQKFYHKYTDAQIESTRQLLVYWNEIYGIPLKYNPEDMWQPSKKALAGEAGVFTHNSYRRDKSDIYPCPRIIEMLKSL